MINLNKTFQPMLVIDRFDYLKRIRLVLAILLLFLANGLLAASITSTVSGGTRSWSDPLSWVGGVVPVSTDDVIIAAGSDVILRSPYNSANPALCATLTIDGSLTMGGGTVGGANVFLGISSFLIINSGGVLTNDGVNSHQINIGGDFTNNGTFDYVLTTGSIGIVLDGTLDQIIDGSPSTLSFGELTLNKPSGQVTTGAGITTIQASDITLTAGNFIAPNNLSLSGDLFLTSGIYSAGANTSIGGDFTNNGATFQAGTGTITFNGTTQFIGGTIATTFNNLITSGSSSTSCLTALIDGDLLIQDGTSFTIQDALTVTGKTTIGNGLSGSLIVTSTTGTKTFNGLFTVSTGATWDNLASDNAHFHAGITNNGTIIPGTGVFFFEGNSQSINGIITLPILDIEAGVTLTNNGTVNVTDRIDGTGTFMQGSNSILNVIGRITSGSILDASAASNTVNYSGSDPLLKSINYVNLGLSGSGTKNLGTASISGNLTLSGTVSIAATNALLTIGGNLLVGDGTEFRINQGLTVTGTTTVGNGASGSLISVSTGGTKTFLGNVIVSTGATFDFSIGENAHFQSGLTNQGSFLSGTAVHYFEVNLAQTFSGTVTMAQLRIEAGVTLTNNGTVDITNLLDGPGTFTQGTNSTLNVIGRITSGTTLDATATNNTVNYLSNDPLSLVKNINYVNLGLGGTIPKPLGLATTSISGNFDLSGSASTTTVVGLTVGGNLSIGSTAGLNNNNTLTINGSLTGAGTLTQSNNAVLNINGGSSLALINGAAPNNTVNYNAASPSIIPGSYYNLILNQPSGVAALLGSISLAGTLTLNTGSLDLAAGNLTLNAAATLAIASPSATRMIITSGAGELRKSFTATGSFTFPIGELTGTAEYSPVTVNVTSAGGFSSAYIGASVTNSKHISNNSSNDFLKRYWNISQSGITSCVASINGTYLASDIAGTEANIVAGQLNGAFNQISNGWKKFSGISGNSLAASGAILENGIPAVFTGISGVSTSVAITGGGGPAVCVGTAVQLGATVTGESPITYAWSPSTGLSADNIINPIATPTITTDYTLTIYDSNGGSASNITTITVSALPVEKVVSDPITCAGTGVDITLTGSEIGVNYLLRLDNDDSPVGSAIAGTGGDITFTVTPGVTTIYNVLATLGASSCNLEITDKATVTVNLLPVEKVVGDPITCEGISVDITLTGSEAGVNYQLRLDSDNSLIGSVVAGTGGDIAFSVTPVATTTYNVFATNATTSCNLALTDKATVTVNAVPLPPTGSATAQPTCSVLTGEITVSSSLTGLSFSINGIDYTNTTGVFTGLLPGDYTITAKNGAGCISPASSIITININPSSPVAPTASATAQPTCSVATGEIKVSSSTTGLTFSIDGIDYNNTTGIFTGLVAGSYTVTAKNASDCISASSPITINVQPATPVAPIASATIQPTCSIATGEITVSSSLVGLSFSIDGTTYTNTTGVFTGLAPGDYTLTAKNGAGCISPASSIITINVNPTSPVAPTASATAQPTCSVATGEITVSSSTAGLTFSIDGIDYTNTTGVFTGLAAGDYTVTAKNGADCISLASSTITINVQPATPVAPTASATIQPSCSVATGEITVSSSLIGLSFSIDGTTYTNTTGVFTGLTPGDYTLTAKNGAGCISLPSSVITINPNPTSPAAPTASVTIQPSCNALTGTIVVTIPANGTGVEYTLTGTNPVVAAQSNATGVFDGLATGNYDVTTTVNGCTSLATALTVSEYILPPIIIPSATLCVGATMTANPATGGTWLSSDAGIATINNEGLITGVSAGMVTFSYTETATGCSGTTTTLTTLALPAKPTITATNTTTENPILTSSSDTGNQWFKDGTAIAGVTGKVLNVSSNGSYSVQVTLNGCAGPMSDPIAIVITGIGESFNSNVASIYPNPARDIIQVDWSNFISGAEIDVNVYDQLGRLVISKEMTSSDNVIDVRSLSKGSYLFLARQNKLKVIQRFIKE